MGVDFSAHLVIGYEVELPKEYSEDYDEFLFFLEKHSLKYKEMGSCYTDYEPMRFFVVDERCDDEVPPSMAMGLIQTMPELRKKIEGLGLNIIGDAVVRSVEFIW
jgi:hypothetical protein